MKPWAAEREVERIARFSPGWLAHRNHAEWPATEQAVRRHAARKKVRGGEIKFVLAEKIGQVRFGCRCQRM